MEFRKGQTIYEQIGDVVRESILTEKWKPNEKVSSVRELAAEIEVNPNTVMRAYSILQEDGILYNKRGIGFFVSEKAKSIIHKIDKELFIEQELPLLFKKMKLLEIDFNELQSLYKKLSKK